MYGDTGQTETPERAADMARIMGSSKAMLLRGHGAVVVGRSIREVCILSLYLEESARLQVEAMKLGGPLYISREDAERIPRGTFKPTSTERAWEHYRSKVKI